MRIGSELQAPQSQVQVHTLNCHLSQEVLGKLLERMGIDQPHHTLWQLLALAHID